MRPASSTVACLAALVRLVAVLRPDASFLGCVATASARWWVVLDGTVRRPVLRLRSPWRTCRAPPPVVAW